MTYPPQPSRRIYMAVVPVVLIVGLLLAGCMPTAERTGTSSSRATSMSGTAAVYFGNMNKNPNGECNVVYPVLRTINYGGESTQLAVLQELFRGPTQQEQEEGYTSFFSSQTATMIRSLRVENGTAYLNIRDIRPLMPSASSSCGSAALLAEITSTLTQFASINRVIIAINGDTQTFYDWLQYGCGDMNDQCNNEPFRSDIE